MSSRKDGGRVKRPLVRSKGHRESSPARPTREQENKLQRLAFLYDRVSVNGSIGADLLVTVERVKDGTSYALDNFRINEDGREV